MADAAAKRKIMAVPGSEKKLKVVRVPDTGLWEIKYTGGGAIPLPLQGTFTSHGGAQRAIDKWLK